MGFLGQKIKDPIVGRADLPTNGEDQMDLSSGKSSLRYSLSSILNAVSRKRNIIAFWIFGIATNFPFIISLSAAEDILNTKTDAVTGGNQNITKSNLTFQEEDKYLQCTPTSTGAILLTAILPDLCVKILIGSTTKQLPYNIKAFLTACFTIASFLVLAFSNILWLKFIGVVFASIGSGLGEITFMSLSCFYHKDVISSWSSGTGASGILGSVIYAGFTSMGFSSESCMLVILTVPVGLLTTYCFMLKPDVKEESKDDMETAQILKKERKNMTLKEKAKSIPQMLPYLIPLLAVYFGVYFILQGLIQLLYFNSQILTKKEQYRWYQVVYRIGAFISRSSVNLFQVKRLYLLPLIPFANIVLLVLEIYYRFIPYLWIVMFLVFLDGFIQGISYVNTFYCITNELEPEFKEFALGLATASRPIGIVIAGGLSLPVHDFICSLNLKM